MRFNFEPWKTVSFSYFRFVLCDVDPLPCAQVGHVSLKGSLPKGAMWRITRHQNRQVHKIFLKPCRVLQSHLPAETDDCTSSSIKFQVGSVSEKNAVLFRHRLGSASPMLYGHWLQIRDRNLIMQIFIIRSLSSATAVLLLSTKRAR